jgi:hypothetical protein
MAVSFGSSVEVGKSDSVEFAGNRRLKFQLRRGHHHVPSLVAWLVRHKPEQLGELRQFLRQVFGI